MLTYPRTRSYKKKMMSRFDRGYEPLLTREGTYVYTEEGN